MEPREFRILKFIYTWGPLVMPIRNRSPSILREVFSSICPELELVPPRKRALTTYFPGEFDASARCDVLLSVPRSRSAT